METSRSLLIPSTAVLAIENIADLRKLPVGLEVKVLSPENNKTGAFTFKISKDFNLFAILDKDLNWAAFKATRPIRNETLLISGEIKSSLYLSAQEVGLPEDVLMEFVQLMGYSVDFQRQIQPGDKFKILFQQSYDTLDNRRLGLEKISYAELDVSGEKLKFYRFCVINFGIFVKLIIRTYVKIFDLIIRIEDMTNKKTENNVNI